MSERHNTLPRLAKPIVLVGLMGVGKTTIGRKLAHRLNIPFTDADLEIECAAGMSVTDIFARFGEPYFRDGEHRVIKRLLVTCPHVIATGGGAFMHDGTREHILKTATSIWIDTDIDELVERVSRRTTRPLLNNGNVSEILINLAAQRNPVFADALIHIKGSAAQVDDVVDTIIDRLERV